MANEVRYNMGVTLTNAGLSDTYNASGKTADQTTQGLMRNVQEVQTSWSGEALDLGSVVTPRMAIFVNLDDTNYVEVGVSVSGDFHGFEKLEAGDVSGPHWLSNLPPYARANTAPVKLFYIIYEA